MKKWIYAFALGLILSSVAIISVNAFEKNDIHIPNNDDFIIKTEEDAQRFTEQEIKKEPVNIQQYENDVIQEINLFDNLNIKIKALTTETKHNYSNVAESADGKVASLQSKDGTYCHEWVIVDGENVEVIDMSFYFFTAVYDSRWIDNNTIQAICHINPSTSYLFTYNKEKGLSVAAGSNFCRNEKNELYYTQGALHFNPVPCPTRIYNEAGKVLYETQTNIWITNLAATEKYLVFYERNPMDENYLRLLVLSIEDGKIVYEYDHPAYGEIVLNQK